MPPKGPMRSKCASDVNRVSGQTPRPIADIAIRRQALRSKVPGLCNLNEKGRMPNRGDLKDLEVNSFGDLEV